MVHDETGRIIDSYDDYGTFSQGVEIRNTFTALNPDNHPKVDLFEVTFADGNVWFAGQPNPMARRQAASVDGVSADLPEDPLH